MRGIAALLGLAAAIEAHASDAVLLHPVFQDHAVLQRDREVRVWGTAAPFAELAVAIADVRVIARADADGAWRATLPVLRAGGPHELKVRSSAGGVQTVRDVLIGDVWLCSGQSNMEMPLRRVTNSDVEIEKSANDAIRLLTIARASSAAPLRTFSAPVAWRAAAPGAVDEFSAACYFFGRELHKATGAPQGLIHSSWGGSAIQTWISAGALHALGGYEESLTLLGLHALSPQLAAERWRNAAHAWWRKRDPTGRTLSALSVADFDDADWSTLRPDGFWEQAGVPALKNFDGIVWHRIAVTLSAQQAREDAVLSLGPVDDLDTTWINGVHVGITEGWNLPRMYAIPRGVLKPGKNIIAVGAYDAGGGGGMWGRPEERSLRFESGSVVQLDGAWRYRISSSAAQVGAPPRIPWRDASGVTTLYNAMIAPLEGYTLKGAAWYQGEANVMESGEYARLLPALMQDWRRGFGAELAFVVVQLAGFGPAAAAPADSAWAALREVQRRVVAEDRNAALAVTLDIGDRYDIHPTNKQEVGRRLALAARRTVYGDSSVASAPIAVGARRIGAQIAVDFMPEGAPLIVFGAKRPIGFELCDRRKDCRFVDAAVERGRIVLDASETPNAALVRYGWADSPVCNLYGAEDLPIGPFELAIQP